MWILFLLLFISYFLVRFVRIRLARNLASDISLMLSSYLDSLPRKITLHPPHYPATLTREFYLDLLSAFSSVFVVFCCMSFSSHVSRFVDKRLRLSFSQSVFNLYLNLVFSILRLHSSGEILTLNGVLGFLDSLLEDKYNFSSDDRASFFHFVFCSSDYSISPDYVIRRDIDLPFKL